MCFLCRWLSLSIVAVAGSPYAEFLPNSAHIDLNDEFQTIVLKMSQGDTGAMSVMIEFDMSTRRLDPDAMPVLNMLGFNSEGILGTHIWRLYTDVCHERILCVHSVMRALQLGLVSRETVYHAIQHQGQGLDVDALFRNVQTELLNFGHEF